MQQLAAAGIDGAARWEAIGNATLDTLLWANASHLVSGDLGHSVRCAPGDCGVAQRGWLDGFDAGASYGSAIAVEAGVDYSLRLVLKSAGHGGVVVASLSSEAGTRLWSHSFPLPAASAGWATVSAVVRPSATTRNATLRITATDSPTAWWLGSASLMRADATAEGLRPDVVEAVAATNFRGLLRYPGGCFSSFYRPTDRPSVSYREPSPMHSPGANRWALALSQQV